MSEKERKRDGSLEAVNIVEGIQTDCYIERFYGRELVERVNVEVVYGWSASGRLV